MIRTVLVAVAACVALSACEESKSSAMAEILKAEQDIAKTRAEALKASTEFLKKKEAEGGWEKTASGVLYKFVRRNEAEIAKPTSDSQVLAYYHGTLPSGEVFDSAYQRGQPAPFSLAQVVKGWQEVVPMMKPEETIDIIVPPALAYGESGRGGVIGPNQALQFRIELLAFANSDGVIVGNANPRPPKDTPEGVTVGGSEGSPPAKQ